MSHYADVIMLLNVGKNAWCMFVSICVCIDIHRWQGEYMLMQADIYEYICIDKHV